MSGKPKGYIGDSGVACWSLAISSPRAVASHPNWGALFETAVFGEVRKALSLLPLRPIVYHWRTSGRAGGRGEPDADRQGCPATATSPFPRSGSG
ncbi:MAG: DUF4143 domain-containing protein [Acidobacteriota bacterium]